MNSSGLDLLLFVVLPYVAIALFFIGAGFRYFVRPFSVSSLSSQFLENRLHFWAEVPFHYGLLVVLAGHLLAFLFPGTLLLFVSEPLRLFTLEAFALASGLVTLLGVTMIIGRRATNAKVLAISTSMDWVLYLLLFIQISSGIWVAIFHSWGSFWFASVLTPYMRSLFAFDPAFLPVISLPLMAKLHLICGVCILALLPFTRLMHVLVAPLQYLFRKPQVVRWYSNTN